MSAFLCVNLNKYVTGITKQKHKCNVLSYNTNLKIRQ